MDLPKIQSTLDQLESEEDNKKKALKKAHRPNSDKDWAQYKRMKKAAQYHCRKAHNEYLANILSGEDDNNLKKLYGYIKSRRCDSSGIAPLRRDGITHIDPKIKAEILNQQFTSLFTNEDTSNMPDLGNSNYQ